VNAIKPMLLEDGDLADLKKPGYVAEEKFDGTRGIVTKKDGNVEIRNRHNVNYTRRLPEIVEAAQQIPGDFTIDGELVYINPEGETMFTPCQRRCATTDYAGIYYLMHTKGIKLHFYAWSLLRRGDENMENWGYLEQKQVLRDLLPENLRIRYTPHRFDLENFFQETREQEREGIVVKRVDSRYVHRRSYLWKKIKNWRHAVCQVVGYTPGKNSRKPYFGSLVLAQNGEYRGCVGSGFSDYDLKTLKETFVPGRRASLDIGKPYTPVQPGLKAQIKYYQVTDAGVMRFPVFEKIVN